MSEKEKSLIITLLRMAQALAEMELDEDMRKLEAAGPDEDYVAPEGTLLYITHASPAMVNPLCSHCVL